MKLFFIFLMTAFIAACGSTGGTTDPGGSNPGGGTAFKCQNPLGGVVEHGASVTLFESSTVAYGSTCKSEARVCNNGALSGSFTKASCEVLPESEPNTHEQPMKISDEGLKMGGVRELGDTYVVSGTSRMFSPPPPPRPICSSQPILGSACARGTPVCMLGEIDYSCEVKKTYKVFGWIYEKHGLDYSKMASNVTVDIFPFAFCMGDSRACGSVAGPVKTDKWGYFEFTSATLFDTLRLDGMQKYYMFCNKGKPIAGGGQYLANSANKPIGPFKQLINEPGVCDQNFLMKMFAEDVAPANPNDIHGDNPVQLK